MNKKKKPIGRPVLPKEERKVNTCIRIHPKTKELLVNEYGSMTAAVNNFIYEFYRKKRDNPIREPLL